MTAISAVITKGFLIYNHGIFHYIQNKKDKILLFQFFFSISDKKPSFLIFSLKDFFYFIKKLKFYQEKINSKGALFSLTLMNYQTHILSNQQKVLQH
jgi:hypothetical protein